MPAYPHLPNSSLTSPTVTPHQPSLLVKSQHQSQKKHHNLNNSGYYPIITGADAFAARILLIRQAKYSIDAQYYIWHNDETGQLMLKELWNAAQRGVKVRLLLDDFNSNAQLDQQLLRFAQNPNIQVRVINPLTHRKLQTLNYVTDLPRINHRMHNKSMTFDDEVSIIGGRNIGDEYLNNKHNEFVDLDVLLVGAIVKDIETSFTQYWQSPLSFDIQTLVHHKKTHENQVFIKYLDKIHQDGKDISNEIYEKSTSHAKLAHNILQDNVPFHWHSMTLVSDDVNKLTQNAPKDKYLLYQVRHQLGQPKKQLTIISSYFVPTKSGVDDLVKLAHQGVQIKILTNSFHATDVAAVHSGYSQWRRTLLKAGIKLYELKAIASAEDRENKLWRAKSQSATSLHAKTFAVDNQKVFIGSYNVDPRSANINTELGVIIDDDVLAKRIDNAISEQLLTQAYEVILTDDNQLNWKTKEYGEIVIYKKEPKMYLVSHLWINLMSILSIDDLL